MDRRQFSLTLVGYSLLGWSGLIQSSSVPSATAIVTSLFTHYESAVNLGQRYLTLFPKEANYDWLIRTTLPDEYNQHDSQILKQTLKMQRQKDFYEGNTVMLDGWILSRTEARLCALLALT
jgi:hypothetical protein